MNPFDDNNYRSGYAADYGLPRVTVADVNAFLSAVFSWMVAGLLLTGIVGFYVAQSGLAASIMRGGNFLMIALLQLGMVWYLSARIERMEPGTATGLFLAYSAVNGLTFAVIFAVYPASLLMNAFGVTSALFLVLALFGRTTKMDLSKVGTIAFGALIALIIAMVVNMFLRSGPFEMLISGAGVVIFGALTAYRMQELTQYAANSAGRDGASDHRAAIIGALGLYLAFINMFLFILRLMSSGRR